MDKIEEVKNEVLVLAERAKGLQITNQEEYSYAGEVLIEIKSRQDKVKDVFKSIIDKAHQAHKEAISKMNEHLKPLVDAETILRNIRGKFAQIQEDKRRAEQSRLADIARKEAEKLAERATKAAEKGNHAKAEELIQQAAEKEVFVPVVPIATIKTEGINSRTDWKFRVVNASLLPRDYLIADEKAIGAFVRATKGERSIPGVQIYSVQTEMVRTR